MSTKLFQNETLSPSEKAKFVAARRSVDMIADGMRVGLGTGSTAAWMVRCLGRRVRQEGLRITGVPTSRRTAELAREVGIRVVTLDEAGWLDLTIDGADEVDPDLALIKGGGAAHLQEKVVARASDRMIVITDPAKDVAQLGAFPLPVEVLDFGINATQRLIADCLSDLGLAGRSIILRQQGDAPLVTDEGNRILDLHLKAIPDAAALACALNQIPGVVENGLFIGICDTVVVGHADGRVVIRDRNGVQEDHVLETDVFDL